MSRKLTTEQFIERARKVHGDKYDYSKAEYVNIDSKVCIICPVHGEFWQTPYCHLRRRHECPKCGITRSTESRRKTNEQYILEAKGVHGGFYSYDKTRYKSAKDKVTITCPIHGDFEQEAGSHLSGCGCPRCMATKMSDNKTMNQEEFLERATKTHKEKYDYSKVKYAGYYNPIIIICPIHGEFEQKPSEHLHGGGCQRCGIEKRTQKITKTKEKFIDDARKVHGEKFNYDKVNYVDSYTAVTITCPKHGDFNQCPVNHLQGRGCPMCSQSRGERAISMFLDAYNINYIPQYRITFRVDDAGIYNARADFYLEYNDKKYIIEFNGQQHYKFTSPYHDTIDALYRQQERDIRLSEWCVEHGITMIIIRYDEINKIEEILTNQLLNN